MAALLPVLVADLADPDARAFLEALAERSGECWIPLVDAPADASHHLLEVYTPGASEPLRLLATPLGPPGFKGFPLRLETFTADPPAAVEVVARPDARRAEVGQARRSAPGIPTVDAPPAPPKTGASKRLDGRRLAGGKLEIESLLGQGMMGAVYRARHRDLGLPIAVKVMREHFQRDVDFGRRFYAEALAVSRLDHPNLVRVIDFGQEPDGLLYLAMEFLDGRSLRQLQAEEGPMSTARIAHVMAQVCAGLGHAHARGILHRDVKPDNVVLVPALDDDGNPTEQAKVLDFGLALLRQEDAKRERFAGTPVYMSPEQCRGDELDARSDVYACGIMIYELATGTVPFLAENPMVVVNRHLSMAPPPMRDLVPDIDPRLERIVQRALRKSRLERHADMRELRAELKALLRPVDEPPLSQPAVSVPAPASSFGASIPPLALPPPSQPGVDARAAETLLRVEPAYSRPPPSSRSVAPRSGVPAPPSSRPRSVLPDWLEEPGTGHQRFLTGLTAGDGTVDALATDPSAWLRKLVGEQDVALFSKLATELETALRALAAKGDARTTWMASSALHGIATDSSPRASRAAAALRVFSDPTWLAPFAERLLAPGTDRETREAARSLVRAAGVAGAYALYGARVRLAKAPEVRAPFVAAMRELGDRAWPVVRAALERIPESALTGAHPVAADLAEDILACTPPVRDESAWLLVQKYVRAKVPSLCRAATSALARVWAERARPLLLALLVESDDGVRAAAIRGLAEIGAIDEAVVRRLASIIVEPVPPGQAAAQGASRQALRSLAVAALARADVDARRQALPLLAHVVRDEANDDETVLAAARALLAAAGPQFRASIDQRAAKSAEPLRSKLFAL